MNVRVIHFVSKRHSLHADMIRDNQMTAGVIHFVSGMLRGTQTTGSATVIFSQISKA